MDNKIKARFEARAKIIKAMAHPTRLFLIDALMREEKCVCEITPHLNIVQPLVSRHLRILKNAGLIKRRKKSTWHYYSLTDNRVLELIDKLTPDFTESIKHKIIEQIHLLPSRHFITDTVTGLEGLGVFDTLKNVLSERDRRDAETDTDYHAYLLNQSLGTLTRLEARAVLDLHEAEFTSESIKVKMDNLSSADRDDLTSLTDEEFDMLLQLKTILGLGNWESGFGYHSTIASLEALRNALNYVYNISVTPDFLESIASEPSYDENVFSLQRLLSHMSTVKELLLYVHDIKDNKTQVSLINTLKEVLLGRSRAFSEGLMS